MHTRARGATHITSFATSRDATYWKRSFDAVSFDPASPAMDDDSGERPEGANDGGVVAPALAVVRLVEHGSVLSDARAAALLQEHVMRTDWSESGGRASLPWRTRAAARTVLHYCVLADLHAAAAKLIDAGADASAADWRLMVTHRSSSYGDRFTDAVCRVQTPLHDVCALGRCEMLIVLLGGRALRDVAGPLGVTPLIAAAIKARVSCMVALLQGGARVDAADDQGCTALHHACYYGFAECVTCLLAHGASPHSVNAEQYTPLLLALREGHVEVAMRLLDSDGGGGDLNAVSIHGSTPIWLSVSRRCDCSRLRMFCFLSLSLSRLTAFASLQSGRRDGAAVARARARRGDATGCAPLDAADARRVRAARCAADGCAAAAVAPMQIDRHER